MPTPRTTALAVGVLCLIWGSTWLAIKWGLEDLPPFGSAALRFGLAAAVMAFLAPVLHRREGGRRPPPRLWLTMGALNFWASYGIVYVCEQHLPSGLVAVLWGVFPLMMAVAGHLFLDGEALTRRHVSGFVLGFAGLVLLFREDIAGFGGEAVPMALLLLGSPLVTAIGTVVVKRDGGGTSSVLLVRNAMAVGAVLLGLHAALVEGGADWRWSARAAGTVVYLALVGTCMTFGLYYWLMRYLPASRLSLIAYVTPVTALVLGWALGGEPLSASMLAGTALVLGGVALARR